MMTQPTDANHTAPQGVFRSTCHFASFFVAAAGPRGHGSRAGPGPIARGPALFRPSRASRGRRCNSGGRHRQRIAGAHCRPGEPSRLEPEEGAAERRGAVGVAGGAGLAGVRRRGGCGLRGCRGPIPHGADHRDHGRRSGVGRAGHAAGCDDGARRGRGNHRLGHRGASGAAGPGGREPGFHRRGWSRDRRLRTRHAHRGHRGGARLRRRRSGATAGWRRGRTC